MQQANAKNVSYHVYKIWVINKVMIFLVLTDIAITEPAVGDFQLPSFIRLIFACPSFEKVIFRFFIAPW